MGMFPLRCVCFLVLLPIKIDCELYPMSNCVAGMRLLGRIVVAGLGALSIVPDTLAIHDTHDVDHSLTHIMLAIR